nr:nuclear transport factor 2 family protein [Candidatus Nitrospira allomarina]
MRGILHFQSLHSILLFNCNPLNLHPAHTLPQIGEVVRAWVDAFNRADAEALAGFYTEDAVNHQVANDPVVGRAAIHKMFAEEFARAEMCCIVERILEIDDWAILEWRDPLGSGMRVFSGAG